MLTFYEFHLMVLLKGIGDIINVCFIKVE